MGKLTYKETKNGVRYFVDEIGKKYAVIDTTFMEGQALLDVWMRQENLILINTLRWQIDVYLTEPDHHYYNTYDLPQALVA